MLDLHNHVLTTFLGSDKFVFPDAFKPFISQGKVQFQAVFDEAMDHAKQILPMVADGFGAVLIFGMTALFYRTQKHQKITQSNEEQSEFIGVKKILSLYLALVFFLIVFLDITRAFNTGVVSFSIQSFYTLLIFTDIFILIFSLRYSSKYYNLFRYSSFALATLFLRLTISAPAYYNVLLAVIAGVLVLGVTYIYNGLLLKSSASKLGS